jgi:hypothetical protein
MSLWAIIVSPALMIGGLLMYALGLRHRTADHPGLVRFHPKYWKPLWKMRPWYAKKGFIQILVGTMLVAAGGILGFTYFLNGID